jgi:hypothetical protein
MSSKIKIIHAKEFVRATSEGRVDLEAGKRLITDIMDATAHLEEFEILLDTRRVEVPLPMGELWLLAQHLLGYRGRWARRTAVLCPFERFDHVRFFASCAEEAGLNVAAFSSYEDAINWLIAGESALPP